MRHRGEDNWGRWPNARNQQNGWPPWPPNVMQPPPQPGGHFPAPWSLDQRPPSAQFSEMDQFQEAYNSDRHQSSHYSQRSHHPAQFRGHFQNPRFSNFNYAPGPSGMQQNTSHPNQNEAPGFPDAEVLLNVVRNDEVCQKEHGMERRLGSVATDGHPVMAYRSQNLRKISIQDSVSEQRKNHTSLRVSQTEHRDSVKKLHQMKKLADERPDTVRNAVEPHSSPTREEANFTSPRCRKRASRGMMNNSPPKPHPSGSKGGNSIQEGYPLGSIVCNNKPSNLNVASGKAASKNNASGSPNSSSHERKRNFPQRARGAFNGSSLLGRPPSVFANQWNWSSWKPIEEDDGNEINQWLQMSKGNEALNGKDRDPVSKDPLPGSEEARINAIKEATNRLKQALKKKMSLNLNELLSTGDEARGENQAQSKVKSFPKNLAQLELDASDMRAIGRANTEKTSSVTDDNSDDDIIVVERPPSPAQLVIDLDISPYKDKHADSPSSESDMIKDTQPEARLSPAEIHSLGCSDDTNPTLQSNAESATTPIRTSDESVESQASTPRCVGLSSNPDTVILSRIEEISEVDSSNCGIRAVTPKVPSAESTSSSYGRLSKNPTSPPSPNFNQSRRRASFSSLGEPFTSSHHSSRGGVGNPHPPQSKPLHFQPGSPPLLSPSDHSSRQRKIISDLQKINQCKLKDLINNPRSRKLDFAMRQLMKEHQTILSKQSRDVAEKRIPAEFLNPKSTDLPPDDNTLLADFAIDWSSLPEELICTLGDLFQDLNSSGNLECPSSSEPCEFSDSVRTLCHSVEEEDKIMDNELPFMQNAENSHVKIRVCQFARENVFSSKESNSTNSKENSLEILHPDLVVPKITDATEPVVSEVTDGSKQVVENSESSITGVIPTIPLSPENANWQSTTRNDNLFQASENQSENVIVPDLRSSDNTVRSGGSPKKDKNGPKQLENIAQSDLSVNLFGCDDDDSDLHMIPKSTKDAPIARLKKKIGKSKSSVKCVANVIHKKKKKKKKQKHNKLVHLEERSWFGDSSSGNTGISGSNKLPSKKNHKNMPKCKKNTPSKKKIETVSLESNTHSLSPENNSETLSFESTVNDLPHVNNIHNVPPKNSESIAKTINKSPGLVGNSIESAFLMNNFSSTLSVDRQCMSMLPVLMMTVPADGIPNTACNLTVIEMEKRIAEIDVALQNMVQERFLLSQALKAAQTFQHNSDSTSELSSHAQPSTENNEPETELPSDARSSVEDDKLTAGSNGDYAAGLAKKKLLKRKCSDTNKNSVAKKSRVDKDSFVQPENIITDVSQSKSNKSGEEAELIILDDDNTDDTRSVVSMNVDCHTRPIVFTSCYGVEGNILAIKAHNTQMYAASQNGLVYQVTMDNEYKYHASAIFGCKSTIGITSIELVHPHLLTGDGDGLFRVYRIPARSKDYDIRFNVKPELTFSISSAIHCLEHNWGFVYIGTKAGTVIPFNLKNEQLGDPLSVTAYPVLCIKSCMEGPRRVLIVGYRHQPIAIRDATSGLLLRSLGGCDWTVYTVLLHKNLVYCGANTDSITVFDFQSGEHKFSLQTGRGIIDLKRQDNLLFCGCYDGKIYVFNLEDKKLLAILDGPSGKMILALQIHKSKMFCGCKGSSLVSCRLPPFLKKVVMLGLKNGKTKAIK